MTTENNISDNEKNDFSPEIENIVETSSKQENPDSKLPENSDNHHLEDTIIEEFQEIQPTENSKVLWWLEMRGSEERYQFTWPDKKKSMDKSSKKI